MKKSSANTILIAGPSGAGKTTFLNLLHAKELPQEIQTMLPLDAHSWPVFEANDFNKDILVNADRQIVHYDTVDIRRYPYSCYDSDPRLTFLIAAESAIIITLEPDAGRLSQQFRHRHTSRRNKKSALKNTWFWIRQTLKKIRNNGSETYEKLDRGSLYESPEAIEYFRSNWSDFLSTIRQKSDGGVVTLTVRPDGTGANGKPVFALSAV